MLNKTFTLTLLLFSLCCSATQAAMEVIPLFNRPASELEPLITPLLEPSDHLVGNGFSLIINTTPARLVEIKELIKKLDTAPVNLSIRVIQSKNKTAEQLNAGANIVVSLNRPADFNGQINISQQNQYSSSNSEQMLKTIEGKLAYIKIGSNQPIHYTTAYDSGYGQHAVATNMQYIEVSTGFAVLPRLNGEQVILEISPWSEQMKNSGTIETQSAQTTVKTQLGQWVEIGTVNEQTQSTTSGVLNAGQVSGQTVIHILVQVEKTQ